MSSSNPTLIYTILINLIVNRRNNIIDIDSLVRVI